MSPATARLGRLADCRTFLASHEQLTKHHATDMTPPVPLSASSPPLSTERSCALRYFYSVAAIVMLGLAIIGFRHFYFHGQSYPGRPITPSIRALLIIHGIAMSVWLILSISQPLLIATRRRKVHMAFGRIGAVVASVIVVLGLVVATKSTAVAIPDETFGGLTPKQFMALPYASILTFGVLVAIGVWYRKRPDIHKPMIFLGTLSAMSAALDRIDAVRELFSNTFLYSIWGPFFSTLAIGAVVLILRCVLTRSFDRWFAIGLTSLFLVFAVTMQVAKTSAWSWFADLLVH